MAQSQTQQLHVVQSIDWRDAVITVLAPGSPYRPWRPEAIEANEGDLVLFVVNTDPPSVVTEVGRVGTDGDPLNALPFGSTLALNLLEASTLAEVLDLDVFAAVPQQLDAATAVKLDDALNDCRFSGVPEERFGHTSIAAARTLLRFHGHCEGCDQPIDLTRPDARDRAVVRTIDPPRRPERTNTAAASDEADAVDWPAVICGGCHDRLRAEGHRTFLDFKLAQHPSCPACSARRTRATFYGMPIDFANIPPWHYSAGCCVSPEEWRCGACGHEW